jgi:hypothetical protein
MHDRPGHSLLLLPIDSPSKTRGYLRRAICFWDWKEPAFIVQK